MQGKEDGLLSLFKGEIKGYVVNPYTGAVMSRRDVLDLYRYLAVKHLKDRNDKWTCEMLNQSRDLLGIPEDLHEDLMLEMRKLDLSQLNVIFKRPIMEEVESLRFFRKGFCPGGEERHLEGEDVEDGSVIWFISDLLEMERGSLLFEMENDGIDLPGDPVLSDDYMVGSECGMMDSIMSVDRKRPKQP